MSYLSEPIVLDGIARHWVAADQSGVLWRDPEGEVALTVFDTDDNDLARVHWERLHPEMSPLAVMAVVRNGWVTIPA